MPPRPVVIGASAIGDFLAQSIFAIAPMRLIEAHANGSPAFAAYRQEPGDSRFVMFALLVLAGDDHQITHIDAFSDPRVLSRFDLPRESAG